MAPSDMLLQRLLGLDAIVGAAANSGFQRPCSESDISLEHELVSGIVKVAGAPNPAGLAANDE